MDYRVFVNDANVDGNGTMVASRTTTYTTTSQFGTDTTVTIRLRATATYWSEVATKSIIVRGKYFLQLHTVHIREYGSTLYVGLARVVSPTNTNFWLTFLLTRLQEALYEDLAV